MKRQGEIVLTVLSSSRRELIGLAEIECPLLDTSRLTNFGTAHFCDLDFQIESYDPEPEIEMTIPVRVI